MLGRIHQLLRGGRGGELGDSDVAPPLLHRLPAVSPGRRSPRDPALLPVRTKVRPLGGSPVAGSSAAGRRGGGRWRQAGAGVLLLLVLAAVAAGAMATALSCYALSTLYEPPAALAAAVAEAHAAAAAAAAGTSNAATQQQVLQWQLQLPSQPQPQQQPQQQLLAAHYTVVIMSHAKRLRTLPLVVNKLGSCPSGGRVGSAPTSCLSVTPCHVRAICRTVAAVLLCLVNLPLNSSPLPLALALRRPVSCSRRGAGGVERRRPALPSPLQQPGASAHPTRSPGEGWVLLLLLCACYAALCCSALR